MKPRKVPPRTLLLLASLLLSFLVPAQTVEARGGGGIGGFTSLGSDRLGRLLGEPLLAFPTGAVNGISGFGYGITHGGWKIGGFGTFFFTAPLSLPIEALGGTLTRVAGGIGGLISGGHGRLGPFTMAINLRLGVGGVGVEYSWTAEGYDPASITAGTVALYGSAEAEVGIVFVPAMMLSIHGGVDALVTFPYVTPAAVPVIGLRVTWGSF